MNREEGKEKNQRSEKKFNNSQIVIPRPQQNLFWKLAWKQIKNILLTLSPVFLLSLQRGQSILLDMLIV